MWEHAFEERRFHSAAATAVLTEGECSGGGIPAAGSRGLGSAFGNRSGASAPKKRHRCPDHQDPPGSALCTTNRHISGHMWSGKASAVYWENKLNFSICMNTFLPAFSQDFTHSFTSWDLDTNNKINKTRNALIGGMQRLKYSTSVWCSSWVALDLTQFDIIHVMERRGTLHVCVGGGIKGLWVQPHWENNRQRLLLFPNYLLNRKSSAALIYPKHIHVSFKYFILFRSKEAECNMGKDWTSYSAGLARVCPRTAMAT